MIIGFYEGKFLNIYFSDLLNFWDVNFIHVGVAGGLTNLSKMPACNVLILGAQRRTLSGFSTAAIMPHTGFIYYSDTVQKTPPVRLIE